MSGTTQGFIKRDKMKAPFVRMNSFQLNISDHPKTAGLN